LALAEMPLQAHYRCGVVTLQHHLEAPLLQSLELPKHRDQLLASCISLQPAEKRAARAALLLSRDRPQPAHPVTSSSVLVQVRINAAEAFLLLLVLREVGPVEAT
jgi:hypothetical protein